MDEQKIICMICKKYKDAHNHNPKEFNICPICYETFPNMTIYSRAQLYNDRE